MNDFLLYDLKVAVLIAVFYMFYRLLLARETFHRVNRVVLLLTAVASFVLPLCVITMHETVVVEAAPQVSIGEVQVDMAAEPAAPHWQNVLPILYIIGVAATLGHTLLSILKVLLLIRRSERHVQPDGITICVTGNARVTPFSWMRYIVMNRDDYAAHDAAILAHERGHIRLRHSWDVLLVDLLTVLQWFNPAMWMLRQDLRDVHEYEADGEVLSQGINARQYQYLLISKAAGIGGYSIANGISHSTLKKRIRMMKNKEYKRSHLLKLLAIAPIVAVTLSLNARTVTDYVYDEPQRQQPVKKGRKAATLTTGGKSMKVVTASAGKSISVKTSKGAGTVALDAPLVKDDEKTYDVCDEMPQFPGGVSELMKFLSTNIRYPKEAEAKGEQGRVIVSFVVGRDGTISDASVRRSISPQLDAEALRVINAMPVWTPGKQQGEPVRVKYTMPITFRLSGEKSNPIVVDEVKKEERTVVVKAINHSEKNVDETKDDFATPERKE